MNRHSVMRIITVLLGALSLGIASVSAQSGSGFFRFVHAVPGVGGVDIYVDEQLTVADLAYGEASDYIAVPDGPKTVVVRQAGITTELWQQTVVSLPDLPVTLVASSLDPLGFEVFEDDFSPVLPGTTRFRLIHAIEGAPPVTVSSGDQPVVSGLSFNESSGGFDIQAATYQFSVSLDDGTELLTGVPFAFRSSTAQMAILYGTPSLPEVMVLTAPTSSNGDAGAVRIAHMASEAPAVDIYANDILLIPALAPGQSTDHLSLPAATYTVELREAGSDTVLLEGELTVEAGTAITVAALTSSDGVDLTVVADNIAPVDATTAVVTITNTIPDSVASIMLFDGTVLASEIAFGESSEALPLDPFVNVPTLMLEVDGQSQDIPLAAISLYGGAYYNGFILLDTSGPFPQPTLFLESTALAQTVGSAPGADMTMVVAAPEDTGDAEAMDETADDMETEDTTADEAAVEPTPEEPAETTDETDTTDTEEEQPTEVAQAEEPTPEPTAAPPIPTLPPAQLGPTGVVTLNPGTNLQLRQLPSDEALSLGLVPGGTRLIINGREGFPGRELPPGAVLNPATTWLNVTYATPDGGEITAWVNALYIDVRDEIGETLDLAELDPIAGNVAGSAEDTAITPPPPPERRVTVRAVGLNPGTNLNIRRSNSRGGEVLAGIPNGSIAEFEGIDRNVEWVFITYLPPEGGSITGWVSINYVIFELNGRQTSLIEISDRELLRLATDDQRGAISATIPPQYQQNQPDPTEDTFVATVQIDPGANLNVRTGPSSGSDVLVRVPSGTEFIVTGRTDDGLWLRVGFEGGQGWVATSFVLVTFNDEVANVDDIPVVGQ